MFESLEDAHGLAHYEKPPIKFEPSPILETHISRIEELRKE